MFYCSLKQMNPAPDTYLANNIEKWEFGNKATLETIKKPVNKLA